MQHLILASTVAALLLVGCGSPDSPNPSVVTPLPTRIRVDIPVSLEDAKRYIERCDVESVLRLHSGKVTLNLRDGRTIELLGADFGIFDDMKAIASDCDVNFWTE